MFYLHNSTLAKAISLVMISLLVENSVSWCAAPKESDALRALATGVPGANTQGSLRAALEGKPAESLSFTDTVAAEKQGQASDKSSSAGNAAEYFIREKMFTGLNNDKNGKNEFGIKELSDAYQIGMVILGKKPVYYPYNNRGVNTQEIARLTGLSYLNVTGLLYNEEMVRDILANDPHYGCVGKQLTLQDIEDMLNRLFSLNPYGKVEGEGKSAGRLLGYSQNTPGNVHIAFWLDEMYDKGIYSLSVDEINPDIEVFVAKILQDLRAVAGLISATGPIIAESGGAIIARSSSAGILTFAAPLAPRAYSVNRAKHIISEAA